jgi:hypothetical protein
MTDDERAELRDKLGGDSLDPSEWTAAWNGELARRMSEIERGEVRLLTEEELFGSDNE